MPASLATRCSQVSAGFAVRKEADDYPTCSVGIERPHAHALAFCWRHLVSHCAHRPTDGHPTMTGWLTSRPGALYIAVGIVIAIVAATQRDWLPLTAAVGIAVILLDAIAARVRRPPGQAGRYAQAWSGRNGATTREVIAERVRTEPRPATVGAGQNSLVVMYWNRWGKNIWVRYGASLLGREQALDRWAEDRDYSVLRPTAPETLTGANAVPALFADETRSSVIYARNKIGITRGTKRALLVDANRYLLPNADKTESLDLVPGTAVICSAEETLSFIVVGKGSGSRDLWLSFTGTKILTGHRRFDARYEVYTQNPDTVMKVLSDAILDEIYLWDGLRVVADRGVLVVAQIGEWTEPKDLDALVDLAFEVSHRAT